MKKILLTTSMLVATAGTAAAEVSLSGSGRVGVVYTESNTPNTNDTTINYRLRFNIDAKFEADNGVEYGGRIRVQNQQGTLGANPSAAYVYVKYSGFTVEVGNSNTAFDSVAILYNSEIGYIGRSSAGIGDYYSFDSDSYAAGEQNRVGVFVGYSVGDLNLRASYIQPDQVNENIPGLDDEFSVSADYKFSQITLAGAYVDNANGVDGDSAYFLGAEYAFNDVGNVGIFYHDTEDTVDGTTVAVYGNYKIDALTLRAFIATNDEPGNAEDTTYGVGADYDLGGATLAAGIFTTRSDDVTADVGVKFSF